MDITRENYESWFVDYLEGNLDEKLVDSFIEFLQENPDLKEELKLFESVVAVPEELTFKPKNKIYKSKYDLEDEFNTTAIAEIEGDLDIEETASFENYLASHPEKQKERALFEKTILSADENIRFGKKEQLYKKTGRKVFLLWAGRVAAILILVLVIFSLIDRIPDTSVIENQLAQTDETGEQKKEVQDNTNQKTLTPVQSQIPELSIKPESQKDENKALPIKESRRRINERATEPAGENLLAKRIPLEVPQTLNSLTASISAPAPFAEMGVMTLVYPDYIPDDERLLTDNLRGKVSIQKITRAGLNLMASISSDRFTYETNKEGQVTEYNYESRLLAFSIPATHPADGE